MQCATTPTPFLLPHARMGETAYLQGEGVGCQLSPAQVGQVGYEELEASSRLAPPSGLGASMKCPGWYSSPVQLSASIPSRFIPNSYR